MTCPKMILFDCGRTLLYEPGYDTLRGEEALFQYVVSNKNNLTPKDANDVAQELFSKTGAARQCGFEIHQWNYQKFLYEYLGITLSLPPQEAERIFWDAASYGAVMPGADRMLDSIHAKGIRSGVVSNISFSGRALTDRINRLLPNNRFEFIIASSEYMFRKPSRYLFELALKKAELDASEVWFCGDTPSSDIEGASNAGMQPVWYEDTTVEDERPGRNQSAKPSCPHLHIRQWSELIAALEELQ